MQVLHGPRHASCWKHASGVTHLQAAQHGSCADLASMKHSRADRGSLHRGLTLRGLARKVAVSTPSRRAHPCPLFGNMCQVWNTGLHLPRPWTPRPVARPSPARCADAGSDARGDRCAACMLLKWSVRIHCSAVAPGQKMPEDGTGPFVDCARVCDVRKAAYGDLSRPQRPSAGTSRQMAVISRKCRIRSRCTSRCFPHRSGGAGRHPRPSD